jgi:hypothetical protein
MPALGDSETDWVLLIAWIPLIAITLPGTILLHTFASVLLAASRCSQWRGRAHYHNIDKYLKITELSINCLGNFIDYE